MTVDDEIDADFAHLT